MKIIVVFMVLLIGIIGTGIFFQSMLNRESLELIRDLDRLEDLIQLQNWEKAESDWTLLEKQWQQKRKKWHAMADHLEIQSVDETLARLGALLHLKESEDCLVEIAVLKQNIRYIPDKEKLTLSNIF